MALLRNDALRNHPYLRRHPSDQRSWSDFIRALNEQSIEPIGAASGGIEIVSALPTLPDTDYPEGAVVFLTTDDKLYRNTDGSTWSKAVDGGDIAANSILGNSIIAGEITAAKLAATLTFTSELEVSTGGQIRQGQTAFDTGAGFWLGDDSGTAKFSIGDSTANKLTWNGSDLTITGSINLTNASGTFAPTWSGFSSAPSGNVTYLDLGVIVIMWVPTTLTGTSNTTAMAWTAGVPEAIRPSGPRVCSLLLIDITTQIGSITVGTSGGATFTIGSVNTSEVDQQTTAFDSGGGAKGITPGAVWIYPK